MTQLNGSPQAIAIGEGYAVRAPGIRGAADLSRPSTTADRARGRGPNDGTEDLDRALAATNVTEVRQVDVRLQPTPPAEATRALRSVDGQETIELQAPDLGPETGQLVLACDETGVVTWHLPVDDALQVQTPTSRGSGNVKRFRIPATQPRPASPAESTQRSLLGVVGRKLLKVLVFPVLDPVIGAISETFTERWEAKNHPYGLRAFSPADRRTPGAGALAASDWDRLTAGRALLFIHGTFSTAHAAFNQIPDPTFEELYRRYGERVFAFNHFSMAHGPKQNIQWLLEQLPAGRSLEVDIVCHSRGGLVARTLAEGAFGLDASRVKVRRIVFVGVPNQGTMLVHPDHMIKMIDRFTSALNLFPSGPVAETLEALITAVKVIGHGALGGLDGLRSMQPGGAFLGQLNQGTASGGDYYGIAADFEPGDGDQGLKALLTGKVDSLVDRCFETAPNDLVVPQIGVYDGNGSAGFPIPDERLLKVPPAARVIHTTLFGYPPTSAKLTEWLG